MPLLAVEPTIKDLTRGFLKKEAQWIEVAMEETKKFLDGLN